MRENILKLMEVLEMRGFKKNVIEEAATNIQLHQVDLVY